jgi:hypothetical protein
MLPFNIKHSPPNIRNFPYRAGAGAHRAHAFSQSLIHRHDRPSRTGDLSPIPLLQRNLRGKPRYQAKKTPISGRK